MIEALKYQVKINGIILNVVNATNPFVSYDLEPKREALQKALTELFEIYENNKELIIKAQDSSSQFTEDEIKVSEEMNLLTRKARDCQIDFFRECFEDFEQARPILKRLNNEEIWELISKIQIAQFGGNSDSKKKIESGSKKKNSFSRATKKRK